MAYLGRYFQGETVHITVQAVDVNGTPTLPQNPPYIDLRSDTALVQQVQAPIIDRYVTTALFVYPLRLNASYPAGRYSATHFYRVTGANAYNGMEVDYFEVVAGGDSDGSIITQHYWSRPEAVYLIQQTESGNVNLKRNPAI